MRRDPLSESEIQSALLGLPGWEREGSKLVRSYRFASFGAAMAFVSEVAALAEKVNHHPDIDIRYRVVRLALWTHDAGAVTRLDVALASEIDAGGGS